MRALIAAIPLLILASCATYPPRDTHTISQTGASGQVEGRPTLGQPISIPGHPVVIIPFAVESQKGLFQKDDPYRRGGVDYAASYSYLASVSKVGYRSTGEVRWHNAILHDLKTGQEWPILDRRGLIGRWEIFGKPPKKDEPFVSRAILFTAVLEDTNHDGLLDDRDARVAVLTDADGRNPRMVSPPDAQVWEASYDPDNDTIFLRVAADTNHDGKFTYDDEALPYTLAPGSTTPATPLIASPTLERVKRWLIDKDQTKEDPGARAGGSR